MNQTSGKLLFETRIKLTFENYETLNRTVNRKAFRRNLIFEIVFSVIWACLNIRLYTLDGKVSSLFWAFFFPVLFVLYHFILRALLKRKCKKIWQSMPDKDKDIYCRFYDDHMEGTGSNGESHYTYDQIYCVNETNDLYFIRVSFIQAFMVEKSSVSPENAAFIRALAPEKPVRGKNKREAA